MKGLKKVFTLLIFPLFSIAVGFTGCTAPVGSLLANSAGPVPDSIKAMPKRYIYTKNQTFMRGDVEVWRISSSGRVPITDTDNIKINIDGAEVPQGETGLTVGSIKEAKTVSVSYQNMEDKYRIQVVDEWEQTDGDGIQIQID